MPDHTDVYKNQAEQYDRLISKQKNMYQTIAAIRPVAGLDIVDMGAGTGRLICALAPEAGSIVALDTSEAMLEVTANKLQQAGFTNWTTQVADHRSLPLEAQCADLVVSGWSICYLGSSNVENWEQNIRQVMTESKRILRPGGTFIIFETLGTGYEAPNPPDFLKGYYSLLENTYGFSHKWIRLDYTFESVEEAEQLARFFFGDVLANKVRNEKRIHLPECAGVWWLTNQ